MNRIKKFIIPLLIFIFSSLASYAQNDCIVAFLANDLSSSATEFKTIVKQPEGFQAWQLLYKEAKTLRTNTEELVQVSQNLEAIKNAGGYLKWKELQGAGNLVPSSLITKLTQQGATELKAWTSGKSLSFVDEAGTVLTGANAETKIFMKLETSIGSKAVLKTTTDANGRLLVQTERGTNSNRVLSIEINKNGQVVVKEYAPSYKSTANTDIDVDLSKGMLAPDYTTKGGKYLYPKKSLHSGQNNVVEIIMTGDMAKDLKAANDAAGFSSFGYKAPKLGEIQFTWHHLDDFNPITGKVSVQLVDQSAHTKVLGMGHSGGVAQYKTFNGSGY